MNVNLNDEKIVKIVYQLDDNTTLDFNYSKGELCGIVENKVSKVLSDSEMMDVFNNSEYMDEIKKARERYKIPVEVAKTLLNDDRNKGLIPQPKKYSTEGLKIAQELIKMDEDGKLDEIVKKRMSDRSLKPFVSPLEDDERNLDVYTCDRSINKLKDEIMKSIEGTEDISNDELTEKVRMYKYYLKKRKELKDEIWNNSVEPIDK